MRPYRAGQSGVVLLAVLGFVLVSTLAATVMVEWAQTRAQREREEQLLFVGDQYRRAIASYAAVAGPGGAQSLPQSVDDLLEDRRLPMGMQHLRRPYPDPFTGSADWELIRDGRGILGVRSRSQKEPLKKSGFPDRYKHFEGRTSYSDWAFAIRQ